MKLANILKSHHHLMQKKCKNINSSYNLVLQNLYGKGLELYATVFIGKGVGGDLFVGFDSVGTQSSTQLCF